MQAFEDLFFSSKISVSFCGVPTEDSPIAENPIEATSNLVSVSLTLASKSLFLA